MNKIKEKYEIILGFVTLALSFSFLNTEFSKVILNLWHFKITLSTYFLITIVSFWISIYLYLLEKVFQDTRIWTWKIWNWVIFVWYWLFVITLIAPIIVICILGVTKISEFLPNNAALISWAISSILSILSGIFSFIFSKKVLKQQKKQIETEIEEKEIIWTENVKRLYKDWYHSQVVIEAFKLVEIHLRKKLLEKNVRVPSFWFQYILNFALELWIINHRNLALLNDLRWLRNKAAHSNIQYTEEQAKFALDVAQEILKF